MILANVLGRSHLDLHPHMQWNFTCPEMRCLTLELHSVALIPSSATGYATCCIPCKPEMGHRFSGVPIAVHQEIKLSLK